MNLKKFIILSLILFLYIFILQTSFNAALAAPFPVTSTSDSGPGSLRQAIFDANDPGADTITFDSTVYPPSSPANINLLTALTSLVDTSGTTIEGGGGVIITCSSDTVGLTICSSNSIIRGLQMKGLKLAVEFDSNFTYMNNLIGGATPAERNVISDNLFAGISLSSANTSNNAIVENYIGTDISGTDTSRNNIFRRKK